MDQHHDFVNLEGDVKKFKSMLNFVFMFGKQEQCPPHNVWPCIFTSPPLL